jgi:hypothetical protein
MHVGKKSLLLAAGFVALSLPSVGRASPFLVIGNDEKIVWDDEGKPVLSPPGKDSVVIVDVAKPEEPKILVSLPLENTVVGRR